MPSSILEKSQEISDKNPNNVDQPAQNEISTVLAKPEFLLRIEQNRDKFISGLNEKGKTELKGTCLSNLQNVRFSQLASFKTKLLSGSTNFIDEEKTWYGRLYVLAKLSSRGLVEIPNDQIVKQIESVWDESYPKYGDTRAVKNKNPWNLKMRGDSGKKDDRKFAIFSTLEAGWAALTNMVQRWTTGGSSVYKPYFSLRQLAAKYCPRNPDYAGNLARYLNKTLKTSIFNTNTQLKNIPRDALAKAIAFHEDGNCYQALKDKGIIQ